MSLGDLEQDHVSCHWAFLRHACHSGPTVQVQLRDRPSMSLNALNWDDHSCYAYSSILDNARNVTILANATAEVAQPAAEANQD